MVVRLPNTDTGENMQNDLETLKKKLIKDMETYFGSDEKRINHAKNVLKYAEQILKEEQADPYVVIPAAILHDVGIKAAETKYGSSAAHYQEQEGPAIAGRMLVEMGYEDSNIYEICAIIARHHSPRPMEDTNFKVIYDADWLVNIGDEVNMEDKVKLKKAIDKIFLTETGKRMAEKIYLS
jgi:HD superfamily phosphohydrolase YqeK